MWLCEKEKWFLHSDSNNEFASNCGLKTNENRSKKFLNCNYRG
jgi:hypothetical protein